jgi:predicted RNA-binding protein Jag
MKKVTKTREQRYDVYVANDGTEFTTEEQCKKYDESAYGVLSAKYKELIVNTDVESGFFGFGSDEATIEIVRVKDEKDADVVMQMLFFINQHLSAIDNKFDYVIERCKMLLERAMKGELLVIDRGYDYEEGFWFVGTDQSMKDEISRICKEKESK